MGFLEPFTWNQFVVWGLNPLKEGPFQNKSHLGSRYTIIYYIHTCLNENLLDWAPFLAIGSCT